MGCGASKDDTADSIRSGGDAGNRRKSKVKPEQVNVDVKASTGKVNQKSTPAKTAPGKETTSNKDDHKKGENKHAQNGDVNGRAGRPKYVKQTTEASFEEPTDKGYKRRVREKLKTATADGDMDELEKMIGVFERSRLDDCGDLTRAHEKLRYLKLRRDLRDAMRRRHVGVLDKTISDVQGSPYAYQLRTQLEAAEKLRDHLKELNRYNHDILQMEQTTISELRSYQRPPNCVHDVMAATYMLLGHDEDRLRDWQDIQLQLGKMGRESLMRNVETFDTNDVEEQTSTRVTEILGYHDLDQVRAASNGAASFHVWSTQMVEKIGKDKQNDEDERRQEEEKQSIASSKEKGRKKKG